MKSILRCLPLFLLLALPALAVPAAAKGPVDQITIAGPGLNGPIEITDPAILSRFDPWAGQFIGTGGPLEWPPDVGVRVPYQAFFYLEDNRGDLQLRYVLYYYPDPAGGPGIIYLPGPGEPYYRVNPGTIIRTNSDGRWHNAMPAWDELMQDVVATEAVSPAGSTNTASLDFAPWIGLLVVVALIGSLAWWGFARRPSPA
ncbi:MAG TPA: hypothetical protein VF177_14495 [Anaerolineae bacterium]